MLTEKQISALRASFPAEALSADNSRGFELTSIKAAFVVERLNEVFGPCGCGWRYVHAPFEMLESEVLTEVALQFKVAQGGVNPVVWDTHSHNWSFIEDGEAWSWPIFSPGGRRPGKGTAPLTDARKGAITDGLTKAASMIGVGHEVFKGMVRTGDARPPAQSPKTQAQPFKPVAYTEPAPAQPNGHAQPAPAPSGDQPPSKTNGAPSNGKAHNGAANPTKANGNGSIQASSTTFWMLANKYTAKLDRADVSALARQVQTGVMSWLEAQSILDDMIEDHSMPVFGAVVKESPAVAVVKDPLDELFA